MFRVVLVVLGILATVVGLLSFIDLNKVYGNVKLDFAGQVLATALNASAFIGFMVFAGLCFIAAAIEKNRKRNES